MEMIPPSERSREVSGCKACGQWLAWGKLPQVLLGKEVTPAGPVSRVGDNRKGAGTASGCVYQNKPFQCPPDAAAAIHPSPRAETRH